MKRKLRIILALVIFAVTCYLIYKKTLQINPNPQFEIGQKLDSLNGVYVLYNGGVGHVGERNLSDDGYNIGLKYQCVEFVKRYYYEFYKHKMPDSYGNAKDFFDRSLKDGEMNKKRDLVQYTNPGRVKPAVGDLLVFDGHTGNPYGHVAIISGVAEDCVEIIQQNPGPFSPSRVKYNLSEKSGIYTIQHERLLGRLRKL